MSQMKDKVETRLAHLANIKGHRKSLEDEKIRLTELIKKVQDDYLNKGKLETKVYENMLKTYAKRLVEVEEQIVFLEAKDAMNKNKILNRIIGRLLKK